MKNLNEIINEMKRLGMKTMYTRIVISCGTQAVQAFSWDGTLESIENVIGTNFCGMEFQLVDWSDTKNVKFINL